MCQEDVPAPNRRDPIDETTAAALVAHVSRQESTSPPRRGGASRRVRFDGRRGGGAAAQRLRRRARKRGSAATRHPRRAARRRSVRRVHVPRPSPRAAGRRRDLLRRTASLGAVRVLADAAPPERAFDDALPDGVAACALCGVRGRRIKRRRRSAPCVPWKPAAAPRRSSAAGLRPRPRGDGPDALRPAAAPRFGEGPVEEAALARFLQKGPAARSRGLLRQFKEDSRGVGGPEASQSL